MILAACALVLYAVYMDYRVTQQFEDRRWVLPAQVYARPLELYPGTLLNPTRLVAELDRLGYRADDAAQEPGTYRTRGGQVDVYSRGFRFWDGNDPSQQISVRFSGSQVTDIQRASGVSLELLRLDPLLIGSIYPRGGEDRSLINLKDVPPKLVAGLMATEDQRFAKHMGLDPLAILRAAIANLRAGRTVQGGSTLTQQLVKNLFLSNERSLRRKINEVVMAISLELHYSKAEILETYLNEVYLGQDGDRAIHGFGLASFFYFRKPVAELQNHELAMLIAIIKGPSYYDPRRHPERIQKRRDYVLDLMTQNRVITAEEAAAAKAKPLMLNAGGSKPATYPAFVDLVRRQLQRDYQAEDLANGGLRIFTTLDPAIQTVVEKTVAKRLPELEKMRRIKAPGLQAAVVVTDTNHGEILAMLGGQDSRYSGFNRALDARRSIGSLVKPAVYLTALEQKDKFTLATQLEDLPFSMRLATGQEWAPKNYEGEGHGSVPMYLALANSYNLATVRLGLSLGVTQVVDTLRRLGMKEDVPAYPSVLLGAISLSPLDVAQIYQTLASGGFRSPLRAIREVTTQDGVPLKRYPVNVEQAIRPGPTYLINRAMQEVVRQGTASSAGRRLPNLAAAGKTGTTDDFRDSWFSGFTGDLAAVVWVGRDDNKPTGLSGASGALPIWTDIIAASSNQALDLTMPADVQEYSVDPATGLLSDGSCPGTISLPFLEGSAPLDQAVCNPLGAAIQPAVNWIKQWWRQ